MTQTPEERFQQLVEYFAAQGEVNLPGRGFGSTSLKVGGKIFAMLAEGRLVVKLPAARVTALVAAGEGAQFDPRRNGRLMKEWLILAAFSKLDWQILATEAREFVAGGK